MAYRLVSIVFCLFLGIPYVAGQQSNPPSTSHPDAPSDQRRILGIGPRFDVSQRNNPRPLSPNEKFRLFVTDATRPYQFAAAAAVTGVSMINHDNRGFGQGGEGFAKRFGTAMADEASSAFFGEFLLPSMLHQDPRYFRQGTGPMATRIGYAVSRVVITRSDSGKQQFNASKVLGAMCSGALGNAYYPETERSPGRTFATIGVNLGTAAGLNLVKEFWPRRKKKH